MRTSLTCSGRTKYKLGTATPSTAVLFTTAGKDQQPITSASKWSEGALVRGAYGCQDEGGNAARRPRKSCTLQTSMRLLRWRHWRSWRFRLHQIVGGYLRPVGGKKAKATGIRKIGRRREDVVQGKLEGTLLTPKG